jgi:hypothetical protein
LLRGRDVDPRVAAYLERAAVGNPLALLELPRALSEAQRRGEAELPQPLAVTEALQAAFAGRIESLPVATRLVLLVAAAEPSGRLGPIQCACIMVGADVDALAAAEDAHLVGVEDGRVSFRHPLISAAAYRAGGAADRRRVHAALSEAADSEPSRAWHLAAAAAGPDEETAFALERAGRAALSAGGAFASAATMLERAAALTPAPARRSERLSLAAALHFHAGSARRAAAALGSAEPDAPDATSRDRLRLQLLGVHPRRTAAVLWDPAGHATGFDLSDPIHRCRVLPPAGASASRKRACVAPTQGDGASDAGNADPTADAPTAIRPRADGPPDLRRARNAGAHAGHRAIGGRLVSAAAGNGTPPRALIVGAGIAGLATAGALDRIGWEVDVVERRAAFNGIPTGLFIPANGTRALCGLGMAESLIARGRTIERLVARTATGTPSAAVDLAQVWPGVGPCSAVLRDLALDAVLEASRAAVRMGSGLCSLQPTRAGVRARLEDGTSESYDLVVGADGVRSTVRGLCCPEAAAAYGGESWWRGVVECPPELEAWTLSMCAGGTSWRFRSAAGRPIGYPATRAPSRSTTRRSEEQHAFASASTICEAPPRGAGPGRGR